MLRLKEKIGSLNQVDGTYYMNVFGKPKIVPAETAIFTDYEWLASGRGYIWSRTIPLLKDNIILGSGWTLLYLNFLSRLCKLP